MTYEEAKRIINSDIVDYGELTKARKIATDCIEKAETADVQPVKHGEWREEYVTGTYFCSECGNDAPYSCIRYNSETTIKEVLSDYCPNCGARMGGNAE